MAVSPQDKLVLDARPALEIVPPITTKEAEAVLTPGSSGNNFKTSFPGDRAQIVSWPQLSTPTCHFCQSASIWSKSWHIFVDLSVNDRGKFKGLAL